MKKNTLLILLLVVSGLQAQVCVWNFKNLKNVKQTNPDAVKVVIKAADKEFEKSITTVMNKFLTPGSGDKHDYMSMGRYWWPDPTKPDGLPYIRKDGVSNPELEKLDRNPLGSFAKNIKTLSLAYFFSEDDKYAKKAVENLRVWFINYDTKMNPNMNYGQTIPGKNNGEGRGEGVLDTYSLVEMLDGLELLKKSDSFTDMDQQIIKQWFVSYLDWMLTSKVGTEEKNAKNNHGTAFDVQIARFALYVDDIDLTKKTIREFPVNRLYVQIEPNGSQPLELARTTALGYSTFNLKHFLDMCQIGKAVKINLLESVSKDGRGILKAIDFLAPFIGTKLADFPYKQIKEWEEVQHKLCEQMFRVDRMLPKPVYEKYYKGRLKTTKDSEIILY